MNPEETIKPETSLVEDTDTELDDAELEDVAGGAATYDPEGHSSRNYEFQPTGHPDRNYNSGPDGHPSRTD